MLFETTQAYQNNYKQDVETNELEYIKKVYTIKVKTQ